MADRIHVDTEQLPVWAHDLNRASDTVGDIRKMLMNIDTSDEWWGKLSGFRTDIHLQNGKNYSGAGARESLNAIRGALLEYGRSLETVAGNVTSAQKRFEEAERKNSGAADRVPTASAMNVNNGKALFGHSRFITEALSLNITTHMTSNTTKCSWWEDFLKESAKTIIKNFGSFGSIASSIWSISTADGNWMKIGKGIIGIGKSAYKAFDKWGDYQKIGRAIGTKQATGYWFKNMLGLSKVKNASKASSWGSRFSANLYNGSSTYSFRSQFGKTFGSFVGKEGAVGAVASWAGLALDLGLNYKSNREEQKQSGMSDTRVIAETVTETGVKLASTTAMTAVIGSAIAATAPVSVPAVVIAAGAGLVIAGVDTGIEYLTGKSATEWISDGIIDGATYVGKKIGDGAKKAGKAISNWWNDLSSSFSFGF